MKLTDEEAFVKGGREWRAGQARENRAGTPPGGEESGAGMHGDCGQSGLQFAKISPARCEQWVGEKQQWVDVSAG